MQDDAPGASPVERNVRPGAIWDATRCAELEKLQDLLHEVGTINKGSNCLGRIERCITLAEQLATTDFDAGRPSFKEFLRSVALDDRFGLRA